VVTGRGLTTFRMPRPFEGKLQLKIVSKLSSFFTENTLCLHCFEKLLITFSEISTVYSNTHIKRVNTLKQAVLMFRKVPRIFTIVLYSRGAQILGARSPERLNFLRWRLTFVSSQHGTNVLSPFWCLEIVCPFVC